MLIDAEIMARPPSWIFENLLFEHWVKVKVNIDLYSASS